MSTKQTEALKLALECIEAWDRGANASDYWRDRFDAITTIREALAEQPAQQQEPVAWPCVIAEADFEKDTITLEMQCSDYMVRAGQHWLSTSPQPSKPWVGLTNQELIDLTAIYSGAPLYCAIEAKLRERNEHREKNA